MKSGRNNWKIICFCEISRGNVVNCMFLVEYLGKFSGLYAFNELYVFSEICSENI